MTVSDDVTLAPEDTRDGGGAYADIAAEEGGGAFPSADLDMSPPAQADDWRAGVPDNLRSFAERFAAPGDAVKSAYDLRRKLSRAAEPPGENASEEERAAWYRRLGRPDTPDGYEIARPESAAAFAGDEETLGAQEASFKEAMHAAGAPPAAVQAAVDWYYTHAADGMTALAAADTEALESARTELRRDWGGDFERNVEYARRALAAFGGDELVGTLGAAGLDTHPAVARAFARIGRQMGEDDMIGRLPAGGSGPGLDRRIEELLAEPDYWQNDKVQFEMRTLMRDAFGDDDPRAGSRGRG